MSNAMVFDGQNDRVVFGNENSGLDFIERYKEIRRRLNPPKAVSIPQRPIAEIVAKKFNKEPPKPKPLAPRTFGVGEHVFENVGYGVRARERIMARPERELCLIKSKTLRNENGKLHAPILSDEDIAAIAASKPEDIRVFEYVCGIVEARHGFGFSFFSKVEGRARRSQNRYEVQARQECAYILLQGFGWTTSEAGRALGGMDHSTISHGRQAYRKMQAANTWSSTLFENFMSTRAFGSGLKRMNAQRTAAKKAREAQAAGA